MCLSKII